MPSRSLAGGNPTPVDNNNRGQVVGTAVISPTEIRPFLWQSGRMIDLGPGNLAALDINNRGQILLQQLIANPDDPHSCFLRDGGTMIDLGNLGGIQCRASDLNNRGQAAGFDTPASGVSHAALWTPGASMGRGRR